MSEIGEHGFRAPGIAGRNGGQREPVDSAIEMLGNDFADGAEPGDGDPLHDLASVILGSLPKAGELASLA